MLFPLWDWGPRRIPMIIIQLCGTGYSVYIVHYTEYIHCSYIHCTPYSVEIDMTYKVYHKSLNSGGNRDLLHSP